MILGKGLPSSHVPVPSMSPSWPAQPWVQSHVRAIILCRCLQVCRLTPVLLRALRVRTLCMVKTIGEILARCCTEHTWFRLVAGPCGLHAPLLSERSTYSESSSCNQLGLPMRCYAIPLGCFEPMHSPLQAERSWSSVHSTPGARFAPVSPQTLGLAVTA